MAQLPHAVSNALALHDAATVRSLPFVVSNNNKKKRDFKIIEKHLQPATEEVGSAAIFKNHHGQFVYDICSVIYFHVEQKRGLLSEPV